MIGELSIEVQDPYVPEPEFRRGMIVRTGGTTYIKGEGHSWTGVYSNDHVNHLGDFDNTIRDDLRSGMGKIVFDPSKN